jgi:hypothetical protein
VKYPITDLYVAETIKRIAATMTNQAGSSIYADAIELARFFELRHWLARLTMDDFERVAQYAKECARRTAKNERMEFSAPTLDDPIGGP